MNCTENEILDSVAIYEDELEYQRNMMLGSLLRDARLAKGYSLDQLSKITRTSKGYIWELENGDRKNPGLFVFMKLASALDIPIDDSLKEKLGFLAQLKEKS